MKKLKLASRRNKEPNAEKAVETPIPEEKIALIDGDFLPYYFGHKTYKVDKVELPQTAELATTRAHLYLLNQLNKANCTHFLMCFDTSTTNNKKDRYPHYKSQRISKKPVYTSQIINYFERTYPTGIFTTSVLANLTNTGYKFMGETDDYIAYLRTKFPKACIISHDKDLIALPGKSFDLNNESISQNTQDDYNKWLASFMIRGDQADNIKGIEGKGLRFALQLMKDKSTEDVFPLILAEYIKRYGLLEGADKFAATFTLLDTQNYWKYLRNYSKETFEQLDRISLKPAEAKFSEYTKLVEQSTELSQIAQNRSEFGSLLREWLGNTYDFYDQATLIRLNDLFLRAVDASVSRHALTSFCNDHFAVRQISPTLRLWMLPVQSRTLMLVNASGNTVALALMSLDAAMREIRLQEEPQEEQNTVTFGTEDTTPFWANIVVNTSIGRPVGTNVSSAPDEPVPPATDTLD